MNLTPTQRLLFNLLQDGYPHSRNELRSQLDEYIEDSTFRTHINLLRNKINKEGLDIVARRSTYQLVRLLHSAYDGKR